MTYEFDQDEKDRLTAAADLIGRSGAKAFECGYLDDDLPIEESRWWAKAQYRGANLMVEEKRSPGEAAEALAERVLDGAQCAHCRRTVVLGRGKGCRWERVGNRWVRGCEGRK